MRLFYYLQKFISLFLLLLFGVFGAVKRSKKGVRCWRGVKAPLFFLLLQRVAGGGYENFFFLTNFKNVI